MGGLGALGALGELGALNTMNPLYPSDDLMMRIPTLTLSFVQLGVALGLFAHPLERRENFAARLMATLAALPFFTAAFWAVVAVPLSWANMPEEMAGLVVQLIFFCGVLAYSTFAITRVTEASIWTALFCCTSGYALQNFASGLLELVWTLRVGTGVAVTAEVDLGRMLPNALCTAAVYVPFYLLVVRKISRRGLEEINNRSLIAIMVVVMLGIIGFDLVVKNLTRRGIELGYAVALRCVHGLLCVLTYALEYELLVSRNLQIEAATAERVAAERERQYELSRANIEAINVKCHDIRHQIRHFGESGAAPDASALADLAREVAVYDSTVRTGNEALDTILTEKHLLCAQENITLSCVADGHALDFMAAADIYSFFGNALDNAIEAVRELDDPALRSISLVVRRAACAASVHVENRFAGALLRNADGSLATHKADGANHGFGVRSMRLTAERYGGTLATVVQGDTFHVNALLPLPASLWSSVGASASGCSCGAYSPRGARARPLCGAP